MAAGGEKEKGGMSERGEKERAGLEGEKQMKGRRRKEKVWCLRRERQTGGREKEE